jgi:hypothetical protein
MKSLWTAKKISVLYGLLFCYWSFAIFVALIVISFSYLIMIFLVRSLPYSSIFQARQDWKNNAWTTLGKF